MSDLDAAIEHLKSDRAHAHCEHAKVVLEELRRETKRADENARIAVEHRSWAHRKAERCQTALTENKRLRARLELAKKFVDDWEPDQLCDCETCAFVKSWKELGDD